MASKKEPKNSPERQKKLEEAYSTLKKIRESTTIKLKPTPLLRSELEAADGTKTPFNLRYYQVQGVYHLLVMSRMILGDDCGLGKTIESIAAMCHMLENRPKLKFLIVTPKSTVPQWASEIARFTHGLKTLTISDKKEKKASDSPLEKRKAIYQEWVDSEESCVLIMNYALVVRDWTAEMYQPLRPDGSPDPKQPIKPGILEQAVNTVSQDENLVIFWDECQAFMNMKTKTWDVAKAASMKGSRVYGLTATLLSSKLMEGYCIYKAIKPEMFTTKQSFYDDYCITQLQSIPGKKIKFPVVVGYKNLNKFREKIDPFFLGRKKQEVSDELPVLISKTIECPLSVAENKKYSEALTGLLALGDGEVKDYTENQALVSLIYCQQIVDSLELLKFAEGEVIGQEFEFSALDYQDIKIGELSAKEEAIVDLTTDGGELADDKVIIYTRFAKLVPRLAKILAKKGVKAVAITGNAGLNKELVDKACPSKTGSGVKANEARQAAQAAFQDPKSDVRVMIITNAGGVGINLQMAKSMIFLDLPWTWGDYVQTLGRMIRLSSPHKGVSVYHLFATRPHTEASRDTIDHHVYSLLRKKQDMIDKILGEAAVGALDFGGEGHATKDLLKLMQKSA